MRRFLITSLFIVALSQEIAAIYPRFSDQSVKIWKEDGVLLQIHPTNRISTLSLNLTDVHSIATNAINDLRLEELHLYSNRNSTELAISTGAFNNVNVTSLHVKNIHFSEETNPFITLKSLTSLTLWNNDFSEFPYDYFTDFPHLDSLAIGIYRNKYYYPISFGQVNAGLRRLKLVDAIVSIYPDTLSHLTNLIDLHIETANMGLLRDDVFSGLQSLVYLILTDCGITGIEENAFQDLPLTILDLSNNLISNIEPNLFLNLPVDTINLSGNKLQEIPTGVFDSTSNLQYLSLGSNELTSIRTGIFEDLKQLYLLDLSNNQINDIGTGAFFGSLMVACNLQNNSIEVLPRGAFMGLSLKSSLNLGGNNITRIESGALKTIVSGSSYHTILLILANSSKFSGELPDDWVVSDSL